MRARFLKRPFDIFLSFCGLIASSPLWLVVAFLIWREDRGPVFYRQERVGRNGRIFTAIKFRSMIQNAENVTGPVQAKKDDPRITRTGKILRATALDELPQLINIMKGDMSFVGPRALRPAEIESDYWELDYYDISTNLKSMFENNEHFQRLEEISGYFERQTVRPGLTGLAQVHLPSDAPRKKKFRYDLIYIKKRSFWLDLKLIVLSFLITFQAKWETRLRK